ncbi:ribose 5-phosphate isomerase B [Vulcanibacillus modesticaldus]|uniref:Ribose 5-phosphate isomerase B n=1 Tax=Vulcanibacillus modesticaldus TaxID=337097 RepID=A0A1D2YVW9_9BACI|nr:ribose 5-phosphate isomerase B [Vulcanibacillus modesticaldus]OEF99842.1 ribose 5-phosphate isomerase B [Vulcanibacillus modesticaldus]
MKVAIASDHGGYELKEHIKAVMDSMGIEYQDLGPNSTESVDYPDYALPVANKVAAQEVDRGILVCGTGIGMSIAANKVKGVRAALVHDCYSARVTRQHNNSNVLCLGGRTTGVLVAEEIVRIWLSEDFEGGRHERRIQKIEKIENSRD